MEASIIPPLRNVLEIPLPQRSLLKPTTEIGSTRHHPPYQATSEHEIVLSSPASEPLSSTWASHVEERLWCWWTIASLLDDPRTTSSPGCWRRYRRRSRCLGCVLARAYTCPALARQRAQRRVVGGDAGPVEAPASASVAVLIVAVDGDGGLGRRRGDGWREHSCAERHRGGEGAEKKDGKEAVLQHSASAVGTVSGGLIIDSDAQGWEEGKGMSHNRPSYTAPTQLAGSTMNHDRGIHGCHTALTGTTRRAKPPRRSLLYDGRSQPGMPLFWKCLLARRHLAHVLPPGNRTHRDVDVCSTLYYIYQDQTPPGSVTRSGLVASPSLPVCIPPPTVAQKT